jgi:hypothetical protein
MDPGYRSPLVDLFLKGGATRDVRLLAARGLLPRPAQEQIALLVVLVDDPDPDIAAIADATISRLPQAALQELLSSDAPAELRAYFADRAARPVVTAPTRPTPAKTEDAPAAPARELAVQGEPVPEAAGDAQTADEAAGSQPADTDQDGEEEDDGTDPRLVSTLPIAARLKLATKGTREQRAQLIRDSNRIVATAVLTGPKLTESEVEAFAKMGNVSEHVLRIIGTNRAWLKNYSIIHAVTRNPKTPPAISMQLMHRLSEKDIKMLSTDRNVPEALRLAARRVLTKAVK